MGSKSGDTQDSPQSVPLDFAIAVQTVMLSKVDLTNTAFCITMRADLDELVLSIQKLGLLHLPILKYNAPKYTIICGFRRIAACKRIGWETVPARILKENVHHLQLARLAIADNASQRPLNLLETSRAVNLLADVCADPEELEMTLHDLGLPSSPSISTKVKKLCQLPLKIQEGILAETINMSMALELGKLDPKAGEDLVALFGLLKVGLNKQRELLLMLKEIAKREDTTITHLIADKALQNILQNAEMDRAVKRQKIRSYLRKRRFPYIVRAEENYQKLVNQLKLGSKIDLIPPKDFEGMTYMMTLRFDSRQELHDLQKKFEKIIHHPSLGKILE